jgi:hypothetical protein
VQGCGGKFEGYRCYMCAGMKERIGKEEREGRG